MQITTLTLCDAATVRENLLHTIGAGLTMLTRPSFPAPLGCDIAVFVSHKQYTPTMDLTIVIREVGKKEPVAEIVVNGVDNNPAPIEQASSATFGGTPLAFDARGFGVPRAGDYVLEASIKNGRGLSYNFSVVEMPDPVDTHR